MDVSLFKSWDNVSEFLYVLQILFKIDQRSWKPVEKLFSINFEKYVNL